MNPLARAIIRCAAAPAAFTYDDIPDQLLRINSLEGSLAFSGSTLTGVTDVSPVGGTVTVTGSPVYTAANANLNGAASFTGPSVTAPNVDIASIRFVASVLYMPDAGTRYIMDGDDVAARLYVNRNAIGSIQTALGTISVAGEASAGRKRHLLALDGTTPSTLNGTNYGTHGLSSLTGLGIAIGQQHAGSNPSSVAFFMA